MRQVYINDLENKLTQLFTQMKSENNHYRFTLFLELFEKNYPEDYQRMKSHYAEACQEFKKNRKGNKKPKPVSVIDQLRRFYDRYIYEHYMKPKNERREKHEQTVFDRAKRLGFKIIKVNGKFQISDLKTRELIREGLNMQQVNEFLKRERIKNDKKSN